MSEPTSVDIRAHLDLVYRAEGGRILATLIRLLGDFDQAEDAMHDAFAVALCRWPVEGIPANPRAWLISAGRFKAIDALRRRTRFEASLPDITDSLHGGARNLRALHSSFDPLPLSVRVLFDGQQPQTLLSTLASRRRSLYHAVLPSFTPPADNVPAHRRGSFAGGRCGGQEGGKKRQNGESHDRRSRSW